MPLPTSHAIWRGQQIAAAVRAAAKRSVSNTCPHHPSHPRACFLCVYGMQAGRFVPTVKQIMANDGPPYLY